MATYTGTIADLMANAGRIQAQRIREAANLQATSQQRIAEIAAAANAQRAQNNINLFGGLAQQVGGTLNDYLQYKAYSDRTKVQQQQEARAQAQFDQQQEDRALARRNDYQSQRAMMPQAAGGGPGDADFGGGPNDPGYGPPRPTPMGLPTTGLPDMPTPGGPPTAPSMGLPTPGMPGGGLPDITPTPDRATPYNHPDRLDPNREIKPTREQMLAGQPTFAHREALTKVFTAIDDQNAKRKKAEDDAKKAQQDALGVTAYGLSKFGMEPNGRINPRALDAAMEEAEASGVPVETLDQLRAGLQARPEMAGQFLDSLISRSETARAMRKDEGTDKPMAVAPGTPLYDFKTGKWIQNPNAKEVTFQAPQTKLVNGKRVDVQRGSDGFWYDMSGGKLDAQSVSPEPEKVTTPTTRYSPQDVVDDTGKTVKANYDALTGRYTTNDGTVIRNPQKPPTDTQAATTTSASKVLTVFSKLSDLSEKINTGKGLIAKAQGAASIAAAQANYNDDVAEYEALIDTYTPIMARANGHTGVLTEQDVQSTKAIFPRPGDSKTLRDRKIKTMESLMGAGGQTPATPPRDEWPEGASVAVRSPKSGKTYYYKTRAEADAAVNKAKAQGLW